MLHFQIRCKSKQEQDITLSLPSNLSIASIIITIYSAGFIGIRIKAEKL